MIVTSEISDSNGNSHVGSVPSLLRNVAEAPITNSVHKGEAFEIIIDPRVGL